MLSPTLERIAGRWGVLARYVHGESRPEVILEGLASIATAAGVKLVLWIEDMERFTGVDRIAPEEAATRETERLGPILSLLYLLDRCDSITVLIGDTSLRSRLDVGKIARFVERPPRPTPASVWRQIAILRARCLTEDFIDPANDEYRKTLTPPDEDTLSFMRSWHGRDMHPSVQGAMALLLHTPRALKSALRTTWETWETLRGEIDFDGVLVASALRITRPDVFTLIDEHVDLFRRGFRDPSTSGQGGRTKHPVLVQLDGLLAKEENERMKDDVTKAISFVFPAYKDGSEDVHLACPQGLGVARHVDYWQRYLALPIVLAQESDQAALKAIAAWRQGDNTDLMARLTDPDRADQIETFVGQFTTAELCELLDDTVLALRHESAETWEDVQRPPGIDSVWRMMHDLRPPVDQLADVVSNLITDLVTHHLPLAHYGSFIRGLPQTRVLRKTRP